jgi:hypothetical protein
LNSKGSVIFNNAISLVMSLEANVKILKDWIKRYSLVLGVLDHTVQVDGADLDCDIVDIAKIESTSNHPRDQERDSGAMGSGYDPRGADYGTSALVLVGGKHRLDGHLIGVALGQDVVATNHANGRRS